MSEIKYPCHEKPPSEWCDHLGPAGFMGHTCQPRARDSIYGEINAEVKRSQRHGEKFASLHEAYAVILEEVDEVWDITRQKRRDRKALELRNEFIQIAAMAVKALESMDNFIGGSV